MSTDIHPKSPTEIAAQIWCKPEHSSEVMNVKLAESFAEALAEEQRHTDAWYETAAQFSRNANFYQGIVRQIGEMFGDAAYISDDGSKQQDILVLKVPELVAAALKGAK